MGASGYTLSCLALIVDVVLGCQLSGHLPGIRDFLVWLPGSQAHVEMGHKDELNWHDKWQDPAYSWWLRWDKRTSVDRARV
jgi:hypothetical protein